MQKSIIFIFIFLLLQVQAQDNSDTGNSTIADSKIAFGPYIQQMGIKDATLCWSTIEGESIIKDLKGRIDTIREYKQHTIHLANLRPNTEYAYDVLNNRLSSVK